MRYVFPLVPWPRNSCLSGQDAVNLQKDGTLKMDLVAQHAAQGSLVIDLSSGEVRSDGEQELLQNDRAAAR